MCPISGFFQSIIVITALILLLETFVAQALRVTFSSKNVTVDMYDTVAVNYTIDLEGEKDPPDMQIKLFTENDYIASAEKHIWLNNLYGSFNITGNFLGKTKVSCKQVNNNKIVPGNMDVIVVRKKRPIDHIFTGSVIILVSIIYINFGCALNWGELRATLKRPIGPVIGFIGQFLLMPLLSFGIGRVLFPNNAEMQLGMFFTGVSPAGGASNIWTVLLEGNMDLSITMTTISTLAAFGMMPLWIFTLGKVIFDHGNLKVPYAHISYSAVGLIIPLLIGYLISRYCKKVAHFLARILKGFSALLIIFIIVFAIVTNLYLFKLFSWQIIVAGMGLPYIGYVLAYIAARILRQPDRDCLAIAIETGIQNTGIAIFLLKTALTEPEADLTTVAPVAVAIMTPFPLIGLYIYKKVIARLSASRTKLEVSSPSLAEGRINNNFSKEHPDPLIATIS